MQPEIRGYEFSYVTSMEVLDPDGNPVLTDVPTTFGLSGITEDVANGIRDGLRTVASIKDVAAVQVLAAQQPLAEAP